MPAVNILRLYLVSNNPGYLRFNLQGYYPQSIIPLVLNA